MINKAILVGRTVADPEIRHTPDGATVVNLRVATDETWKDRNGEKIQKTEWHRVAIFGKLAEIAGKFLTKGRLVYIEGRIQTRKWTDKEGTDHYSTGIVAILLKMLDSTKTNGACAAPQEVVQELDQDLPDYDQGIPF